ncbi:MAG: hypothetical protein AB7V14_05015 [Kiritimatiellia bacterium]
MDEVKWAWVLFLAATLALIVRLAMWFWPGPSSSPALDRKAQIDEAAEQASAVAQAERPVSPPPETPLPAAEEKRDDWGMPRPAAVRLPEPVAPAPAVAAPPPEEFHLRWTRWGMTPEEVRAAERIEPLRAGEDRLVYSVFTHEMPSLLAYSFEQGRLVRARISFSDPAGVDIPPLTVAQAQRRFLYLREQLRSRYGEPVEKTTHVPRDSSDLDRRAQKQEELAKQYDAEIAEAEARLKKQREKLEKKFARWSKPAEYVARGLAPYERDLRELRQWKQDALALADRSRKTIQAHREADASRPLVASMSARWPDARGFHDVHLRMDLRGAAPTLDVRYEALRTLPRFRRMDEL